MRRALLVLVLAALFAGSARADTFTIVGATAALPSATVPNAPGEIVLPFGVSTPPAQPQALSYPQLLGLWQSAGAAYGVPWEVLASINRIESDFGRNMGPSYAGAIGWMQFMPSTWESWGVDANGDGVADPWNPTDAVYSAARYLVAAGAHDDLARAVFAYNHSQEYVDAVLAGAAGFAQDPLGIGLGIDLPVGLGASIPDLEQDLAEARGHVDELNARVAGLEDASQHATWDLDAAVQRAGDPTLSDADFAAAQAVVSQLTQAQAGLQAELDAVGAELQQASAQVVRLEQELAIARVEAGSGDLDGLLPAAPTEAAHRIIQYAVSQLGVPYQWGGNHGFSLEQMIQDEPNLAYGFDCSSFLAWSFAKGAGLYVGDWTGSQWEYGVTAPGASRGPGPAQGGAEPVGGYLPGDMIFFNDTDHVGLYIGNDLFVQAPRTGDVVKISRLSTYTPVWGWVRYAQVSGVEAPDAVELPAAEPGERVFTIVPELDTANGGIVLFARS